MDENALEKNSHLIPEGKAVDVGHKGDRWAMKLKDGKLLPITIVYSEEMILVAHGDPSIVSSTNERTQRYIRQFLIPDQHGEPFDLWKELRINPSYKVVFRPGQTSEVYDDERVVYIVPPYTIDDLHEDIHEVLHTQQGEDENLRYFFKRSHAVRQQHITRATKAFGAIMELLRKGYDPGILFSEACRIADVVYTSRADPALTVNITVKPDLFKSLEFIADVIIEQDVHERHLAALELLESKRGVILDAVPALGRDRPFRSFSQLSVEQRKAFKEYYGSEENLRAQNAVSYLHALLITYGAHKPLSTLCAEHEIDFKGPEYTRSLYEKLRAHADSVRLKVDAELQKGSTIPTNTA